MIKAYKKKEAYEAVRALRNGEPEKVDLDRLVMFFAPVRVSKPKTAEQWAALACGTKDLRTALNYLYVHDGNAVGCDGHRVHIAKTSLVDGYYCPRTFDRVELDAAYPDYRRAISWAENTSGEYSIEEERAIPDVGRAVRLGDKWVNAQYYQDAAPTGGVVALGGPSTGVAGISAFGRFAIMACRI